MNKFIITILMLLAVSSATQAEFLQQSQQNQNNTINHESSNQKQIMLNKLNEIERVAVINIIDKNDQNCSELQLKIQFNVQNESFKGIQDICQEFVSQLNTFLEMQTQNQQIKITPKATFDNKCYLAFDQQNKNKKLINTKNNSEICQVAKNEAKNYLKSLRAEQYLSFLGYSLRDNNYYIQLDQTNQQYTTINIDQIDLEISKNNKIFEQDLDKRILQDTASNSGSIFKNAKDQDDSSDIFVQQHFRTCLGNLGILLFVSHTVMYFALQGDDKDIPIKKESIFDQPYLSFSRQQSQIQENGQDNRPNIQNSNNVPNQNQDEQLHQLNQFSNVHNRISSEIIQNNINNHIENHNNQAQNQQQQLVEINLNNLNNNIIIDNNNNININNNNNNNQIQIDLENNRSIQRNNSQYNQNRVFPAQQNQNNPDIRIKYNSKIIFLHARYAYYKKIENTPRWMRIFFIFVYMSIFQMILSIFLQQKFSQNIYLFIIVNALTWLGVYLYSGIFYLIFYIISPQDRENNKCSKYFIIFLIYVLNLLYVTSNYTRTQQDSSRLFYWPILYLLIDQFAIDYVFLYISMKYSLIRYAKLFSIKASPNQ
ncbi:transmembrane protein, putative (macronuclear) [Tetrahymena thermophila SB210]|uniref:Transmembrane protein, putative n=1 Tax=Tetrahymena thermophila (strain SB210) TaxID=312017 RepID=Q22W62_TETTS|nr:transmembrane protein, putative [Tetrahymena thermophila SB210]EAR89555.2 transmembrane protein, putative [Tetrahymena thermophila SB210]|eukprot:XP_001009800.2 transmembrane protein, putative [Tetrahymena thermophila SB210]